MNAKEIDLASVQDTAKNLVKRLRLKTGFVSILFPYTKLERNGSNECDELLVRCYTHGYVPFLMVPGWLKGPRTTIGIEYRKMEDVQSRGHTISGIQQNTGSGMQPGHLRRSSQKAIHTLP